MKCPGCDAEVVERAVFCHHCGARLDLPQADGHGQDAAAADSFNPGPEREDIAADSFNSGSEHKNIAPGQSSNGQSPQPPAARQEANSTQSNAQRLREAVGTNTDAVESDLWEGGYCAKAMLGSWLLGGFLSVCFLALGIWIWSKGWSTTFVWWGVLVAFAALWLYLFARLLRRRLGVHYRLSSQRFFHEKGILRHTTDLIEVIDMDDITFEQTLIDRMTGVGSIHIVSSDRSHPELTIVGIGNVKEVAAKMHDARHAERLRRGLHIEQI